MLIQIPAAPFPIYLLAIMHLGNQQRMAQVLGPLPLDEALDFSLAQFQLFQAFGDGSPVSNKENLKKQQKPQHIYLEINCAYLPRHRQGWKILGLLNFDKLCRTFPVILFPDTEMPVPGPGHLLVRDACCIWRNSQHWQFIPLLWACFSSAYTKIGVIPYLSSKYFISILV